MSVDNRSPATDLRFETLPDPAVEAVLGLIEEEPDQEGLEGVVGRCLERLVERGRVRSQESANLPQLVQRLTKAASLAEMRHLLFSGQAYASLVVVEALIEASQNMSHRDPSRGLSLGLLALEAAKTADPQRVGRRIRNDALAEAWASLGAIHRSRCNQRSAEAAFSKAEERLARGSDNLIVRATVLYQKATLRCNQRRFDEALTLIEEALVIARSSRDEALLPKVLINKGVTFSYMERPESAIPYYREALKLLSKGSHGGHGELLLAAQSNLASDLTQVGNFAEARSLLNKAADACLALERPIDGLRVRWRMGLLAEREGNTKDAETTLSEVHDELLGHGLHIDAARAGLDLAALCARQGRRRELLTLARSLLPIFQAEDIHREAFAALSFCCQAAEEGRLTITTICRVSTFLGELSSEPGRRFEPFDN